MEKFHIIKYRTEPLCFDLLYISRLSRNRMAGKGENSDQSKQLPMVDSEGSVCQQLPNLLSSFVDTFVDFSVSGGVFLPPENPSPLPQIDAGSSSSPPPNRSFQTRYPPQERLIAIGDLHGDLAKSKEAFRLAKLIDASGKWIGGSATVVQVGDVLDRGGDELKILYFLEKLKREAVKHGGKIITMNGNHEIMNMEGDFRFATNAGLEEFRVWGEWLTVGNKIKALCEGLDKPTDPFEGIPSTFRGVKEEFFSGIRARIAALRPNGPISGRFLSQNLTVLIVGDSVFVHGGLLPQHVSYGLERINEEVRDWTKGLSGKFAPDYCRRSGAVVWLRKYSDELEKNCDCELLEHALNTIPGARRMIMGHTIQQLGINGVCDNKAIRIDVGMSNGCTNGYPEVLEINGNSQPRILTSNPMYQTDLKYSHNTERKKEGLRLVLPENGQTQVEVKA